MYDKTIAADHRIYNISIPSISTGTKILDLLNTDQLNEYRSIITTGLESNPSIRGKPHQLYKRIPVDGYILCPLKSILVGHASTCCFEPVPIGIQYVCPFYFWPEKVYVKATNDETSVDAYIRIFFS